MIWKPLLKENSTHKSVMLKLEEIKEALSYNTNETGQENFFGGDLGISLFFFYYYSLTKEESNLDIAEKLLGNAYEAVENNIHPYFSFASGISGVCWTSEFLKTEGYVDIDTDDFFPDIDPILSKYMLEEMQRGNYDYMHGSLGAALYFLKKDLTPTSRANIGTIVDQLNVLDKAGKRKWNYYYYEDKLEDSTNLGLSHGIPSVLVLLLKAHQLNISVEKSKILIDDIVNYLLKNRQDPAVNNTYYDYYINNETHKAPQRSSRLAWCYGDLGVSCALWQVAKSFNDNLLKQKVLEMMNYSATRRDLGKNMVYDAGLCHGTAGIAHIFNRFYQDTSLQIFKESAEFWYGQTLQMATFKDGLAGYKTCTKIDNSQEYSYQNHTGLLEGIAGIGLALIASVANFEPKWDECLLIS